MAARVYEPEMINWLRIWYQKYRQRELTARFNEKFGMNKSLIQIRSVLRANGITCGRKPGWKKGECLHLFTFDQAEFIRREYRVRPIREVRERLRDSYGVDVTVGQLFAFAKRQGFKSGRTGHFQKGHKPFNAGTKGVMKGSSTSFKPGRNPPNRKPIGSERLDKDGYVVVKVADKHPNPTNTSGWWRHKQILEYEKHHGPIPPGYIVRFADGNKTNFAPENLILVTRGEHARLTRMRYHDQPAVLKPAVLAVARLDQAVYEKDRADENT